MNQVYHPGEIEIQQKVGEQLTAESNGRVITNTVAKGAVNFIEKQPMAIVSSVSPAGQVWISLLIGDFGFTTVPHPQTLVFDQSMIRSDPGDIFYQNIGQNPQIGSLFIELSTRRRYRINGISSRNGTRIEVSIQEAYPNCPKYIQRRVLSSSEHFKATPAHTMRGEQLGKPEKDWIQNADTLFVGSRSKELRMDASHRGGNPGFVEILDDNTLKIPDYQGNSMYNTLGNITQNPASGILLIDFQKGETLQLTGSAQLLFGQQAGHDLHKTTGTGRYWLFKTHEWIRTLNHHQVAWEFLDYSPFNP